ncbi:hypothetical protein EMIT0P253_320042 [Pseudomonas sp. IT-P253]
MERDHLCASLLAKDVNDNAFVPNERIAFKPFASKLAPTGDRAPQTSDAHPATPRRPATLVDTD